MATIAAKFFSLTGRLSRGQYWTYSLGLIIGFFVAFALFLIVVTKVFPSEIPIVVKALGIFLFVLVLLSSLSIFTRRLHDRNKSAWWLLPFYIVPQIDLSSLAKQLDPMMFLAVAVVALILGIWGFVETGFLRGREGPNAYGDDPLAAR